MPTLDNARREAFARALAAGSSADAAYKRAGYRPSRSAASRLSANVNIKNRVAEILAPAIEEARWDFEARLELLRTTAMEARAEGNHRAVIAAVAESNRMQGSYMPVLKERADSSIESLLAAEMVSILADRPALPVGAPHLRGISEQT